MQDITQMSHIELMKEKHEAIAARTVSQEALNAGYTRGSTRFRLALSQQIIDVVDAELARRKAEDVT